MRVIRKSLKERQKWWWMGQFCLFFLFGFIRVIIIIIIGLGEDRKKIKKGL